jgi:hypothetical protein
MLLLRQTIADIVTSIALGSSTPTCPCCKHVHLYMHTLLLLLLLKLTVAETVSCT